MKLAVPAGLIAFASVLPLTEGSRSSGLAWLLLAGLCPPGCCLLICCWSANNNRGKPCTHNMINCIHCCSLYNLISSELLCICTFEILTHINYQKLSLTLIHSHIAKVPSRNTCLYNLRCTSQFHQPNRKENFPFTIMHLSCYHYNYWELTVNRLTSTLFRLQYM